MSLVSLGADAAALAAIIGVAALAWKGLGRMLRTMRKLGHLADEVLGDGGERPGWGQRLAGLERDMAAVKRTSATVAAEVKPNGGASLKDQITRIEQATGATKETP